MTTHLSEDRTSLPLSARGRIARPRVAMRLALGLGLFILALPMVLSFVPWQQNVPTSGVVSAVDPLDRIQTIPAPVSGRLVRVNVQEGARVETGDVLAELEDLDPNYALRLEQQFEFARDELESAHGNLESLDAQVIQLQDERDFAIQTATSELQVAIEKVRVQREQLIGLQAERDQKRADAERKQRLFEQDLRSELDYQKAKSDYELSESKVRSTEAKIDQALSEEAAKSASVAKVGAEKQAKIDETRAKRREAEQKLQQVRKKVTEAETASARQATQRVLSPRSGTVLRIHGASSSGLVSKGAPLIEFVPDTETLAAEMWVRGVDGPLVTPGRKVRLIFEGWPAVQVAGWPSVAVGTFGGIVRLADARAGADGRTRVIVTPDPEEPAWPVPPALRQGVRATGWVQLDTVSIGYELWRQLNAFPTSVRTEKTKDGSKPKAPSVKSGGKS